MARKSVLVVSIGLLICTFTYADVVINEISYNPPDEQYTAGSIREFIELYNPGSESIDLSGYQFSKGTTFVIPDGTTIEPHSYLLLARDPTLRNWRFVSCTVLGPLEGKLSNSGERLTLARPDGTVVDEVKYNDNLPWSRKADGYGSTLERIAWDLPSDDYHTWRASLLDEGTPGEANSVSGIRPRPVITSHDTVPKHPTSEDDVTVQLGFDAANVIKSVTLRWEIAEQGREGGSYEGPEYYVSTGDNFQYWKGSDAPSEGDEWATPDFDDSSWRRGQGTFGYGGTWWNRDRTELNDMRNNYTSVFLRRTFSIPDADTLKTVFLQVYFSGGFVCYLNGRVVASANVTEPVTHESTSTRTNDVNSPQVVEISNESGFLLEQGNVIAIVGMNFRINQTQFKIGAALYEGEHNPVDIPDEFEQVVMTRAAESVDSVTFEAKIPAAPSQTLVRYNAKVTLDDDTVLVLPYVSALRPFESYFVYDGEIDSLLPVLWPYYESAVHLAEIEMMVSGVVILPVTSSYPEVYDGALLYSSRNGQKLKFLKGEEYQYYRTLNVLPERPRGGTTAGESTPHREDFAYWFFEGFGVPAPGAEWYRFIDNGEHSQRLLIEQINERFLEENGLDSDADLFKRNYVNPLWEPHTNLENGTQSIDALERALRATDQDELHEAITTNLVMEEFLNYIVASVLISNWDGFHNNNWMYLDPDSQKWQIIPWDNDKAWGYTDSDPMFVEMPIDFPLNGRAREAGRDPGPITGRLMRDPIFYDSYIERLGDEFNHAFSEERLFAEIGDLEQFLLADVEKIEEAVGETQRNRRDQIEESYETIRTFIRLRREYLSEFLPTPVSDWSLY